MSDVKVSIKRRLIFLSTILLFLVTTGLISYNYSSSLNETKKMNQSVIISESQERNLLIEGYFNELCEITRGLAIAASEIKEDTNVVNKREVIENIAASILDNNEDIASIYIGFELESFEGLDPEYKGVFHNGENSKFTSHIFNGDNGVEITSLDEFELLDFYVIPKATDKPIITEPYLLNVNGKDIMVSTVSLPLFYDGKFIGVVGMNGAIDNIHNLLLRSSHSDIPIRSLIVTSEGTIAFSNHSQNDKLQHVYKYYPEYNDDFRVVNKEGIKTRYEDDLFKVLLPLTIEDTNTNWYLFNDIEKSYILNKTYDQVVKQIVLVLLLTIVVLLIFANIITRILKPLLTFTNEISEFEVDDIDNDPFETENLRYKEVSILAKSFNELLKKINLEFQSKNKRDRLLRNQKDVIDLLHRNRVLHDLGSKLIRELTKKSDGQLGVFYIKDSSIDEANYYRFASYAYYSKKNNKYSYSLGEGLIGQVALDKEIKVIEQIPSEYYSVKSGIGESLPRNLVIVPCHVNDDVVAIFEIGSIHKFDEETLTFLNSVRFDIAGSFESILASEQTNRLLVKTTEQREELDLRQKELELQQEELSVANEELEASINQLEYNNKELEAAHLINNKRAEELEKLNKFKSEFLANMSHELRTPLNSILILSELLRENDNLNSKELQYAETIRRSGEDLLELINDVLDLSKVETGKETISLSKMDVDEFLKELELDFSPVADKNNTNFSIEKFEGVPKELIIDQRKVKQILKNLLSNAFKFTKKGNVSLSVKVNENNCLFIVKDDGIGISKDKQDLIFGAFKQEDVSISKIYGGTGLGLSISKEYALLLGGDITLESEQDLGSVFTLIIPINYTELKQINESDKKEQVEKKDIENYYIPDDRYSILNGDKVVLLVDDDPSFTRLVMEYLSVQKYKVIVTNTGENALHLADFYMPMVIVLDVRLPGISGYETLDRLKRNDRTKSIPVYITSGSEKEESADKATKFYQKPINLKQIQEIMDDSVHQRIRNVMVIVENETQKESLHNFIKDNYLVNVTSKSQHISLEDEDRIDLVVLDLGEDKKNLEFIDSLRNDIPVITCIEKPLEIDNLSIESNVYVSSQHGLLDEIKLFLHSVKVDSTPMGMGLKDKTVLIVDDDMRNVFSLSSLLESNGITVKFVDCAKEAFDMLESNEIDLVLMDIMMPEIDGYEAMTTIRSNNKFENLPIIAITAKAMKGDRAKCISAGANEYCSKPIDKNKLLSILRVWL